MICWLNHEYRARGGGVALYFDSNLDLMVKPRSDLSDKNCNSFESMFVQVSQNQLKTKDILVGVVYRPPNTSLDGFYEDFFETMNKINMENRPCYILGDFNIDLLNARTENQMFLNQLLACGFYPCIDKPTRVSETSATLIDNILTNVHNNNSMSGIWVADVADHLPVYIALSLGTDTLDKNVPRTYQKRFYSNDGLAKFKKCLNECDWSDVIKMENANDKYNHFIRKLTVMHDEHFPLKNVTVDPKRELKPWLTNAILNSVKKKNNMYKNYLKSRSQTLLEKI